MLALANGNGRDKMALHKHSARTVRKPCKCHGTVAVYSGIHGRDLGKYWAHDSDCHDPQFNPCPECGQYGKFVLVDATDANTAAEVGDELSEGTRHNRSATPAERTPAPPAFKRVCVRHGCTSDAEEGDLCLEHATEPAPDSTPTPQAQPGGDVAAAMATLMASLTPQIDTETVRRMVKDEFNAAVFPTRTVIIDPDGNDATPRDLPDAQHENFADILQILSAAKSCPVPMAVLMVGPAGSGKSTVARNAATALNLSYGEISLNPMLPVTNLLGYMNATGDYVTTEFRRRWEHGGVFHADEFDNGHPSTMATLNAALACGRGGAIAFPDGMVPKHENFVFIASANTFGRGPDRVYVGRQQLDAATLNRFVTFELGYDEALEHAMCSSTGLDSAKVTEVLRYVRAVRANVTTKKMTVLMTPRNAVFACTLLRAGVEPDAVIRQTLRAGMSDADWHKATEGVAPLAV